MQAINIGNNMMKFSFANDKIAKVLYLKTLEYKNLRCMCAI